MKKILIVEDEESMRNILVRVLRSIGGWGVFHAGDSREATNIMIRKKFDLVLLDINMPGVDGCTMFDVIKEYDPSLKVVVCSVYPIEKQKQMLAGADDYYDKSQGSFILLVKIYNILKERMDFSQEMR